MAKVGGKTEPWVVGDAIAHQDFEMPAGVYRAEIWFDLLTTMQPVSTTVDFTIK